MPWDICARKKLIHAMPLNTDRPIDHAMVVKCAISATRNRLKLHMPRTLNPPPGQHSCRNAKVVEVFCDAGWRFSTRCRPSIHRPPVDALRVPTKMPIALSWAPLHAVMHAGRGCARAYHREQRRHAIPITLAASQCPTARDFVPWRFLVAGRFSARSVSSSRRPKTCT